MKKLLATLIAGVIVASCAAVAVSAEEVGTSSPIGASTAADDKTSPETGVALALIPAAIAGSAVVFARKRK